MNPSASSIDDRQLLLRTHRGDERAARALWQAHGPALALYARSIVRSTHDADDIVQAVFCRILKLSRVTIAAVNDVRPWLVTLTRATALNHIRSARRERARRTHAHQSGSYGATPPALPPLVPHDDLHAALASLPRRLREPIVLKFSAGLTFDQMAAALGVNRSTIASRYQTGLDLLSKMLGSDGESDSPSSRAATNGRIRSHEVTHG